MHWNITGTNLDKIFNDTYFKIKNPFLGDT